MGTKVNESLGRTGRIARRVGGIRLGRECEVRHALGKWNATLGHADLLDCLCRGDGEWERARVGIADVF